MRGVGLTLALLGLLGLLGGRTLARTVGPASLGRRRGPGRAGPLSLRGNRGPADGLFSEVVLTLRLAEQHLVQGDGRLVHLSRRGPYCGRARGRERGGGP